jgi:hypothetical protein
MTLKIETSIGAGKTVIRLFGEIKSRHIELIEAKMNQRDDQIALDLGQVDLVDVNVVRFLAACEANGIKLLHCPRYVREWITQEQE